MVEKILESGLALEGHRRRRRRKVPRRGVRGSGQRREAEGKPGARDEIASKGKERPTLSNAPENSIK